MRYFILLIPLLIWGCAAKEPMVGSHIYDLKTDTQENARITFMMTAPESVRLQTKGDNLLIIFPLGSRFSDEAIQKIRNINTHCGFGTIRITRTPLVKLTCQSGVKVYPEIGKEWFDMVLVLPNEK